MTNTTDTNQASEDDQASRMGIHMAMLAKAENAKDAGHATVIKLGFAVSIAEELIRTEKLKTKIDLLKTIRRSYPKRRTLQGNAQSKLTLADIDRLIGETKLEAELQNK